jgi:hypothetical protein
LLLITRSNVGISYLRLSLFIPYQALRKAVD